MAIINYLNMTHFKCFNVNITIKAAQAHHVVHQADHHLVHGCLCEYILEFH